MATPLNTRSRSRTTGVRLPDPSQVDSPEQRSSRKKTTQQDTDQPGAKGTSQETLTVAVHTSGSTGTVMSSTTDAKTEVALRQQIEEMGRQIQQMKSQTASGRHQSISAPAPSPRDPRLQDLPNYEGAIGQRLDDWLAELEQIAQYNSISDRRTVEYGVVHFKGAARTWWASLDAAVRGTIVDHAALAAALRSRFQPITSTATARSDLYALVQGSRSVDAYIAEFQRLTAQLPSMSEDDRVFQFARGIRKDIKDRLTLDGVSSLQQAILIAARIGNLTDHVPRTSAGSYGHHTARVHQMDAMDDVDAPTPQTATDARLHRLEQTMTQTLNQLQSFAAGNGGVGAKTQTRRGYQQSHGGGQPSGPRQGKPFQPSRAPQIPGIPEDVVQRRWDNKQCLRCGEGDHRSIACPNPISSSN